MHGWFNKEHREYVEARAVWEKSLSQDVYTVAEVAKLLHKSESTISNWIKRGELRATKVGKRGTVIPKKAIVDFMVPERNVFDFYGE